MQVTRFPFLKAHTLYKFKLFIDDMGSYNGYCKGSNMETAEENALWSINNARQHDNLRPLDLEDIIYFWKRKNIVFEEICAWFSELSNLDFTSARRTSIHKYE